jgi:hypothetical protein
MCDSPILATLFYKLIEELKKRDNTLFLERILHKSTEVNIKQRIFLLFEELIFLKKISIILFREHRNDVQVDIFFHHFNIQVLKKLITESKGNYTKYIIMPTNLIEAAAVKKPYQLMKCTY